MKRISKGEILKIRERNGVAHKVGSKSGIKFEGGTQDRGTNESREVQHDQNEVL
jgi:hypothetical protein